MWRWTGHKTLALSLSKSFKMDCYTGASCGLQANEANHSGKHFFPEKTNDGIYYNQLYSDTQISSECQTMWKYEFDLCN